MSLLISVNIDYEILKTATHELLVKESHLYLHRQEICKHF